MDPADPAFSHPTKQVGPHYTREVRSGSRAVVISGWAGANSQQSLHATTYLPMSAGSTVRLGRDATTGSPTPPPSVSLSCAARLQEAEAYAREKGWAVAPDGDAFRRVVASPLPRDIVEARAVQVLLQVRCAGDGNAAAAAASALRWGRERGSCCCKCAALGTGTRQLLLQVRCVGDGNAAAAAAAVLLLLPPGTAAELSPPRSACPNLGFCTGRDPGGVLRRGRHPSGGGPWQRGAVWR